MNEMTKEEAKQVIRDVTGSKGASVDLFIKAIKVVSKYIDLQNSTMRDLEEWANSKE